MDSLPRWQSGKVIRDTLMMAGLLAALNAFIAPEDWGWTEINPTPWLLPALLIGARYGVPGGLFAGVLTAALVTWMRGRHEAAGFQDVFHERLFLLSSLPLAGVIAGEINHLLRGDRHATDAHNQSLKTEVERLQAELDVMRETRHELEQRLMLHHAATATLDEDLRKLALLPKDQAPGALLRLLHDLCGVTSAGLYAVDGRSLRCRATLHPTAPLAERLSLDRVELASKALDQGALAALSSPFDSTQDQPFLAALPWQGDSGTSVLLVQDMPLDRFDWRNLARLEFICHWTAVVRRHLQDFGTGHEVRGFAAMEDFMVLLAQALHAEQMHHLPSSVLRLDFIAPSRTSPNQVHRSLTAMLPASSILTVLPGDAGIAVLLPFSGDAAAVDLMRRVNTAQPSLRATHYLVEGPLRVEDLWKRIMEPEAAAA